MDSYLHYILNVCISCGLLGGIYKHSYWHVQWRHQVTSDATNLKANEITFYKNLGYSVCVFNFKCSRIINEKYTRSGGMLSVNYI